MSRYQQAPYSDNAYDNNQYGNSYSGGYSDDPQAGGYNKHGAAGATGGGHAYPMSSNNPYASAGSHRGYDNAPKKRNKWLWIGLPILILIIIGAVLGGVLGTQLNKNDNKSSGTSSSGSDKSGNSNTGVPSGVTSVNTATSTGVNGQRYLAVATDSYALPVYATGTNTAGYSSPTVLSDAKTNGKWPTDPNPPSNSSIRDHPRIGAPGYKWNALVSGLIANDPYFNYWNASIVANASADLSKDPFPYDVDGGLAGSGVLDVARQMKRRVKNLAYAYKVTNETKYADRAWRELLTAAGNNSDVSFGADDGTRWNPQHFLDVGEFCATFAIGYDWLYDYWTADQKNALMWSIINLGLKLGLSNLTGSSIAWWAGNPTMVNGNWNCVINSGLTMAALAIMGDDPTGTAQSIIDATVPNAKSNCFQGALEGGTWAETSDYWYFGTTGAGEMVASLIASYGDDRGLSTVNSNWKDTALYHIYSQGMTSKFQWGDHGPNKYSTTANSLFVWASVFNEPLYALYQRDHSDAPEPWSMFWYDPATSGTWWDGLALDKNFKADEQDWATARSTWSENDGSFWAMKAGELTGHQTHGDLDLGDFVVDAIGQRWFGELGSGQYLSTGYFSSEAQDSQRWLYYRKRTEGQNTVLIGEQNQLVTAKPSSNFGTTGTSQGAAPSFNVTTSDTAFYTVDISSGYNNTVKRGIRFLNGRKQILIQDDISGVASGTDVQWRAHTNATVTTNNATATLTLGGETLIASILNGPSGASFSTAQPTRAASDPAVPTANAEYDGDVPNPGVTVLVVDNPNGGDYSLEILLNPQWPNFDTSAFVTPKSVGLDSWSLTSHD